MKFLSPIQAIAGIVGNLTGNADTATTLKTARTINGVSFDGSANITMPDVGDANTVQGLFIQRGNPQITPTAANTVTAYTVTFPVAFSAGCVPTVCVSTGTSLPQNCQISYLNVTNTGFTIEFIRTSTTTTGVSWVAVGY